MKMEGANSCKKNTKREFNWTEEETLLLLHVIIDYKGTKMVQGVDRETIKAKQEKITVQFHLHCPKVGSGVSTKEYIATNTQARVSLFPRFLRCVAPNRLIRLRSCSNKASL